MPTGVAVPAGMGAIVVAFAGPGEVEEAVVAMVSGVLPEGGFRGGENGEGDASGTEMRQDGRSVQALVAADVRGGDVRAEKSWRRRDESGLR